MFEMRKVIPVGNLELRQAEIVPAKGKLDVTSAKIELEGLLKNSSSFTIVPIHSTTHFANLLTLLGDVSTYLPIPSPVPLDKIIEIIKIGLDANSHAGFRIEGFEHKDAVIYIKDSRSVSQRMAKAFNGDYDFVYKGFALYQMRGHYGGEGKTGPLIGSSNRDESTPNICTTILNLCCSGALDVHYLIYCCYIITVLSSFL